MAIYYNIPSELESLIQITRREALANNTSEFKEAIILQMYGSLKIAIDGNVGRDYSEMADAVYERMLFDSNNPASWEAQVIALTKKYI